jgi:hypothetical protein
VAATGVVAEALELTPAAGVVAGADVSGMGETKTVETTGEDSAGAEAIG